MYGCGRSVSAGATVFVPAIAEKEGEEEAAELDATMVVVNVDDFQFFDI